MTRKHRGTVGYGLGPAQLGTLRGTHNRNALSQTVATVAIDLIA